ncbi:MAG TPA: hypothetical protein VF494_10260 [Candidatus Limnocylindrales bacterium]
MGRPSRQAGRPPDIRPGSRPPRPVLVELAAAVLVVGALLSIVSSIEVVFRFASEGQPTDPFAAITTGVGLGLLVLGLLVRSGRAWLVTVNVVAVVAFLELISSSIVGLLFGGLDVFVLLALVRERPWFEWRPEDPDGC